MKKTAVYQAAQAEMAGGPARGAGSHLQQEASGNGLPSWLG